MAAACPPGPGAGAFLLDPGSPSAQLSGFCQTGQDPRTVTLCPRGSSVSLRGGQTGGIDTHPADERARGAGPRDRAGLVFTPVRSVSALSLPPLPPPPPRDLPASSPREPTQPTQAATTGEPARRHQRPSVTETSPARARTTAVRRAEVAVSERVGRVRRTP